MMILEGSILFQKIAEKYESITILLNQKKNEKKIYIYIRVILIDLII
jgi:hypothetical protein